MGLPNYPSGARHTIAVPHYWVETEIVVLAAMYAAAALHRFVFKDDRLRWMAVLGLEANGE